MLVDPGVYENKHLGPLGIWEKRGYKGVLHTKPWWLSQKTRHREEINLDSTQTKLNSPQKCHPKKTSNTSPPPKERCIGDSFWIRQMFQLKPSPPTAVPITPGKPENLLAFGNDTQVGVEGWLRILLHTHLSSWVFFPPKHLQVADFAFFYETRDWNLL